MLLDLESIPGFKPDARLDFVYVQAANPQEFRKFMSAAKILPGVPKPTSGMMMNEEQYLVTPEKESFFVVSLAGDKAAWRTIMRAYAASKGKRVAEVEGADLVIEGGRHIRLDECTLESSDGK